MKKTLAPLVLAACAFACGPCAFAQAAPAQIVGDPGAATAKIEMCIGCHGIAGGYKTAFPEVYRVPMIGGQSAKYIEAALKSYRKGDRKHPTMTGIARSLSDQDIADIAAYYSRQTLAQR